MYETYFTQITEEQGMSTKDQKENDYLYTIYMKKT